MIAEVYPLKRMSRGLSAFDYLVPENLRVERGMFVRIPYRRALLTGVVKRLKDKPMRGIQLKSIDQVYEGNTLREEELSFFESIARELFQSPATLLYSAFSHMPKSDDCRAAKTSFAWLPLTLPRCEGTVVVRLVRSMCERSQAFIQTPDIRRATALILGYMQISEKQKVLILAPTVRDVDLIRSRLSGLDPWIITGTETAVERFRRWRAFRVAPTGVLLGTRTAGLMIDASITTIFLVRSCDANHKQEDRNPRYDMRELVWDLHERFATNLFCLDVVPRPQLLSKLAPTEIFSWPITQEVRVIDLNKDQASRSRSISFEAEQILGDAFAHGRVLIVHNQKGVARLVLCGDCGHRPQCKDCGTSQTAFPQTLVCALCHNREPMILHCQRCRGSNLIHVGAGNEDVAQEMKKLFPDASVAILDKEHPKDSGERILIVTSYFLEACYDVFRPEHFAAVLLVNVDAPLYRDSPSAIESLVRELWQWRWLAHTSHAPFLVQTGSVALVQMALQDPERVLREDLASRKSYHLPPFYRWFRVQLKEEETRKAQIELAGLKDRLSEIAGIQFGALTFNQGQDGVLEFGVPIKNVEALSTLFTSLPDRYIIDTGLFS
ncbi:MAG: hypothetical protein WC654_04925 [Patescibacteria group bacterium]